jgi:hypothetical protein
MPTPIAKATFIQKRAGTACNFSNVVAASNNMRRSLTRPSAEPKRKLAGQSL